MEFPLHVRFVCLKQFWMCCACSMLVINLLLSGSAALAPTSSRNETDRSALLAVKRQITDDPLGALSSWNDSLHHCDWRGITCSRRHHDRVTILELQSQKLEGTLSPCIGNLSFLRAIRLGENNFHGEIPQELSHLFRLQNLNLSKNSFNSGIPTNLSRCTELRKIDLQDNKLSGNIISELSLLSKLNFLHLAENEFTGEIPPSLGNLSSLISFLLMENHLEGSIPKNLCRIGSLESFLISSNNLTGMIPSCLYNQSKMSFFYVADNQLEGSLPPNMNLYFPNIQEIHFGENKFSGLFPVSLPNSTRLESFVFAINYFTGRIPRDIGRLPALRQVWFNQNQLGTKDGDDLEFITSLTNCSNLERINFARNFLRGPIPYSISNLSTQMKILIIGGNQIHGSIPEGIQNLVNLEVIALYENTLKGNIPAVLGKLTKLKEMYLSWNVLSGKVPDSLGNLTQVTKLDLGHNQLRGSIPGTLGNCQNLAGLDLSFNQLTGTIPKQVIGISSLTIGLLLQGNSLTGSLPTQVGNLTNLVELKLSENKLSGIIPESLGNCLSLVSLQMDDNFFEGEIPKSLSTLAGLKYVDLSKNNLSGEIPKYLEKFPLLILNLSFNQLEGQVQNTGVFGNASLVSVVGNKNLCGGIAELKLPPCFRKSKKTSFPVKVVIPVVAGFLCLFFLSGAFRMCYRRKLSKKNQISTALFDQLYKRITYSELYNATNGFSADNLIGIGSYGSVFKGLLRAINQNVAVKVFNLQREGASQSFLTECKAARNIRHRNLLKIITACSSVDFQGNEFKALVFEFMSNGSLQDWLHPRVNEQSVESRVLNFTQRLDIAIDVASVLEYLHHHCQPRIIHCDIKPSNVLLDDDMTARVVDFGIAKVFSSTSYDFSQSQASPVAFEGSIGYVAPEYGMSNELSTLGDVYSYGILLLEMFTGKKPTDGMFLDGLNLHNYSKMAWPNQVLKIVDPRLQEEDNGREQNTVVLNNIKNIQHECLVLSIRLGVKCSVESPMERISMKEVSTELQRIKLHYHGIKSLEGLLD